MKLNYEKRLRPGAIISYELVDRHRAEASSVSYPHENKMFFHASGTCAGEDPLSAYPMGAALS